jgi:hypothetical protein
MAGHAHRCAELFVMTGAAIGLWVRGIMSDMPDQPSLGAPAVQQSADVGLGRKIVTCAQLGWSIAFCKSIRRRTEPAGGKWSARP